jgi:hypothetical protein
MALAETLAKTAFADLLRLEDVTFRPQWSQQRSGTGGGDTLYADRAPMRWVAEAKTIQIPNADAEALMALINSRAGGLKSVLLYNPKVPFPSTDPNGTIFGAATPLLGTITDRLHVAFTGFPANYQLPYGTYFEVRFGGTRYYLGQFAETKVASSGGAVTAVEITPALPASVVAGAAVTVIKPCGKFRIVPNSAYPASSGPLHSRVQFSAEQTYSA